MTDSLLGFMAALEALDREQPVTEVTSPFSCPPTRLVGPLLAGTSRPPRLGRPLSDAHHSCPLASLRRSDYTWTSRAARRRRPAHGPSSGMSGGFPLIMPLWLGRSQPEMGRAVCHGQGPGGPGGCCARSRGVSRGGRRAWTRGLETVVAAGGAHRPRGARESPYKSARAHSERVWRAGRSQGWRAGPGASQRARARPGEINSSRDPAICTS